MLWFYGLRDDIIIQAKDKVEEYTLLNCPQEYDGPFYSELEAQEYRDKHPNLTISFNKMLKEMEEFY